MLTGFPFKQVPPHCQTHDLAIEHFDRCLTAFISALRLDEPELVDDYQTGERNEAVDTPK